MTNISVVVRTLNSAETIEDCLTSLSSQTYRDYEVLVVDEHSTDHTLQIVQKYPTRVFQNSPARNPCNRGIEEARGKIVAFIDSDCIAPPDWLTRIVEHFGEGGVAAVGGEEFSPSTSNYWPRCFEALRKMEKKFLFHWGSLEQVSTCNVAYRKDALLEVGGFHDDLFHGEETELNWRLTKSKWKIVFDPKLAVQHNRRSTLGKYLKQQFSAGIGVGRLVRMHPQILKPSHLAMVGLLVTTMILAVLLLSHRFSVALQLVGGFLAFAVAVSSYAGFVAKETKLVPGILVAAIVFVLARCSGFLIGLADSR